MRFIHHPEVGVKWKWNRLWRSSHLCTAGVSWGERSSSTRLILFKNLQGHHRHDGSSASEITKDHHRRSPKADIAAAASSGPKVPTDPAATGQHPQNPVFCTLSVKDRTRCPLGQAKFRGPSSTRVENRSKGGSGPLGLAGMGLTCAEEWSNLVITGLPHDACPFRRR